MSVVPVHFLNCAPIARSCALIARNCAPIEGYQVVQNVKTQRRYAKSILWSLVPMCILPRKHKLGNRCSFRCKTRFQDWLPPAWVWANFVDFSKSLLYYCNRSKGVKWVWTPKSAHIHWNPQKVRRPSKNAQGWQKVYPTRGLPEKVLQWSLQVSISIQQLYL